jgi:nucleotide-binding universal stress UspA family protein
MDENGRIVVGTDGSPAAAIAVHYALCEAVRRSLPLQVVAAVAAPDYWTEAYAMARALPAMPDMRDTARTAAQAQIDQAVAADPALGSVEVVVDVHSGQAGRALVESAAGADLLIIGHRGHGALTSAILGSVGLYCVLHATGPVTIVPTDWKPVPVRSAPAASAAANS